jgi:hypothetical protein
LECEYIRFQKQGGEKICETKGSGTIVLPENVGAWIEKGKARCTEID